MRKIAILSGLLTLSTIVLGFTPMYNIEKIKSDTRNMSYLNLLYQYKSNDMSLTRENYRTLYYGQVFCSNYECKLDAFNPARELKYIYSGAYDLRKELAYHLEILRNQPFALYHIARVHILYTTIKDMNLAKLWERKYSYLIKSIFSSGSGDIDYPLTVAHLDDIHEVIKILKLEVIDSKFVEIKKNNYCIISCKPNDKFKANKIYFDINLVMEGLASISKNGK